MKRALDREPGSRAPRPGSTAANLHRNLCLRGHSHLCTHLTRSPWGLDELWVGLSPCALTELSFSYRRYSPSRFLGGGGGNWLLLHLSHPQVSLGPLGRIPRRYLFSFSLSNSLLPSLVSMWTPGEQRELFEMGQRNRGKPQSPHREIHPSPLGVYGGGSPRDLPPPLLSARDPWATVG